MTASYQSIQLYSSKNSDGSFTVTGVHWLTQNAGAIKPLPAFSSAYAGIVASDLALLRAGSIVEVPFATESYLAATTQAQVDTDIATGTAAYSFASMQSALTALAPPLTTATSRGFNGTTWGAISSATIFDPSKKLVAEATFVAASGLVPGLSYQRATGYTPTSSTALKAVMATTYTPQTTSVQRSVVSTSALDAAAGTGAQQVLIVGLTGAFVVVSETVTLNGLTPVATANNYQYIESMVVTQTGSTGSNQGVVSIGTTTSGGAAWASIAVNGGVGDNQTFYAHHYVPAGVTCYLRWFGASGSAATAITQVAILASLGNPSVTNIPITQIGPTIVVPGNDQRDHYFDAIHVAGPNLIQGYTRPLAGTANTSYSNFEWVQF